MGKATTTKSTQSSRASAQRGKAGAPTAKLPPKYVNPKTGQTWSGRGRPPAWVKNVKDRSRLLIASSANRPAGSRTASSTGVSVANGEGAKRVAAKKVTLRGAVPVKAARAGRPRQAAPIRIAIGENALQPLVILSECTSVAAYKKAKPLGDHGGRIARLLAMFQAVPSLLVAKEASRKHIMEVVVNGDLVRAADGNGLRAFAMGPKGIKEHARLFDVAKLQNFISAAAIWQGASVLLAQKHLADISRKLDEIQGGVRVISDFLDDQRASRILAASDYLSQAYQSIQGGELSGSVRIELERVDPNLREIQIHLEREFARKVDDRVKHREVMGTAELSADIERKIDALAALGQDLELCLRTRIAAWHVLSLYPGETHLKAARRASIEQSLASFESLGLNFKKGIGAEIAAMKSFLNRSATLARKARLDDLGVAVHRALTQSVQHGSAALARSAELLLADGRPTRIFLEFDNGTLAEARLAD